MVDAFTNKDDLNNFNDNIEVLLSAIYHQIVKPGDVVIDGGANGGYIQYLLVG